MGASDSRSPLPAADDCRLQRLDPRLKLLLLALLVIATFTARDFTRLAWVAVPAVALLLWRPSLVVLYCRRLYRLRWLLLFTLLLHLLLTPGRTLLGQRFLSLDGLLRGLQVDLQLMLAFCFALALAGLTSPDALAWGLSWLLRPVHRWRRRRDDDGDLLVLALHLVPEVFVRGGPILDQVRKRSAGGLAARLELLTGAIGTLLLDLLARGEELARQIHRGAAPWQRGGEEFAWRRSDSLVLIAALCCFGLYWSL